MNLGIPKAYRSVGLAVLPIRLDGSKAPAIGRNEGWHQVQKTDQEIAQAFAGDVGIGIVCGPISGNLEVLDIEGRFEHASELFKKLRMSLGDRLLRQLVIVKTPSGGFHIYYRVEAAGANLIRSQKVAMSKDGECLIETRGKGSYVVAPGSPIEVHANQKPYRLVSGDFRQIPVLTVEQFATIRFLASKFNQDKQGTKGKRKENTPSNKTANDSKSLASALNLDSTSYSLSDHPKETELDRFIDRFNHEVDWADILIPFDWTYAESDGDLWIRPNKETEGISASTQKTPESTVDFAMLRVFSSNAAPLEMDQNYSPFSAVIALYYGGDRKRACRDIAEYYRQKNRLQELLDSGMKIEWLLGDKPQAQDEFFHKTMTR